MSEVKRARWKYHLRILALGAMPLGGLLAFVYAMTLVPWWVAEIPLLAFMAYCFGRIVELWASAECPAPLRRIDDGEE